LSTRELKNKIKL